MNLTGPQKAALVLLGLDEDVAADVLKHLGDADLKALAKSADSLDPKVVGALDVAFEEFEILMRSPMGIAPRGAGAYLRTLAERAIGTDRVQQVLAAPSMQSEPLETLASAKAASLAEALQDEHPQVAAVIISQLPRSRAVGVLNLMPEELQGELLGRIATLQEVPAETVQTASDALVKALAAAGALSQTQGSREFDGVAFAAGMLNELPAPDTERLMGALEEKYGKVAPRIRQAMFTFEDLARINSRALQVLMREVQAEQVLIALKTASEDLREHFLSAVSSRAAASMRDDLSVMPPMKLSDVEKAQQEVVECALRLAAEGRLQLPGASAEKMV